MKASMKIITWNINSLRLRVPHFKAVLENIDADIICVQEMKCQNHEVPAEAMVAAMAAATRRHPGRLRASPTRCAPVST